MEAMRNHIFQNGSFEGVIDRKKVLGAGFSYGSATASLESVMNPEAYRAVILWDGWFFIDQGEGIPFPKEAHDSGLKHKALFVGSTEFSNYKKLSGYTKSLIKTGLNGTRSLVLPNSKHEHFTDCPFWLPTTLVEALSGKKEGGYLRSYIKLRDEMIAFIESTCG
uniref:1-alkyl-2-acetylglycerophosphocholine esterase n=1 Tax=Amorphochlora amoebiformis TaxID=1561963 RepID=A0A7S0DRZ6_9EUKA|mmetsp:Transcript_7493/g.11597  ORF Transcript_7493/g.11597 Transcript_7493/m.11597 type:complete len:165 (+) Transcript_7493:1-495(+)